MYAYDGQPTDAALNNNSQSHPSLAASHSSYPQATGFDLDYQQPHHNSSHFVNVPGPVSQSSDLGDQTLASFPYTPLSFPGHASHSANTFPDPHFIDLPTNLRDRHDLVMPGADEDPSMSFVDDPFQFTLDPHVGYHLVYNPSAIPYQGSGLSHPSPSQYFPVFPPPIVSVDGISTLVPGSEDIGPLGELLHLDEPLSLGDSFHIRKPSPPPPCPSGSHNRQPPEKPFEIKFWPYPTCPFLTEQERKTAAHEALVSAASVYDEEYGSRWGAENLTVFYKSFTMPPSTDIMSTCKKSAHGMAKIGYDLHSSIWSEDHEPQYLIDMVKDLINNPLFPLKFIFGNDSGNHQVDKMHPFEHHIIRTVVINTILKLGYVPYITELDALFCTAAAAVECALQELASGQLNTSIDFGVSNFKPRYTLLSEYIHNHIKTNPESSARWEEFKNRIRARLVDITAYHA
ncbi:uncharacterized protein EDB91DRAFT_1253291 [Suillus paluster]|uniref:uncharacterized protein n=1 Tax=Suillus paluster TaxID=48578 RepID=UPI001B864D03|nr:uncharacterized protein EDB91DRAFT_1253291 [Suillus paluster]KAG1728861.1 hypothetical protein EDB91DRAFT_1253291 [Suillus paluster]